MLKEKNRAILLIGIIVITFIVTVIYVKEKQKVIVERKNYIKAKDEFIEYMGSNGELESIVTKYYRVNKNDFVEISSDNENNIDFIVSYGLIKEDTNNKIIIGYEWLTRERINSYSLSYSIQPDKVKEVNNFRRDYYEREKIKDKWKLKSSAENEGFETYKNSIYIFENYRNEKKLYNKKDIITIDMGESIIDDSTIQFAYSTYGNIKYKVNEIKNEVDYLTDDSISKISIKVNE
ncbi:hypothetical protein ACQPU1_11845 [Clostridium paraputrificum]|uniref:hypothetical protein n=1 Tax=Clostridium TaxID=1485 RepID=UPI003D34C29C